MASEPKEYGSSTTSQPTIETAGIEGQQVTSSQKTLTSCNQDLMTSSLHELSSPTVEDNNTQGNGDSDLQDPHADPDLHESMDSTHDTDVTKPLLVDDKNVGNVEKNPPKINEFTEHSVPEEVPDVPQMDFFEEPTPPVPPDGGYGWVIVACSFMMNLLVDGMCYMGGMLYIELLDYFQQPKGKTQWVHTLVPAVYLLTGPFVGALVNKFGCRLISIIGSIIGAVFFIISSQAPCVEMMIGTYGVMIGLGFGMMYLPAVCFVSYYFDRRRALATGIAVCGSGIGTFIFPPFMNFLISTYGWRGSLLILSGLCLNCCVFGAMLRPLEASGPKPKKIPKEQKKSWKELKKEKKMKKELEARRSIIMQKIIEQKKRQRNISNGSLDGTVITTNNKLVKDPDLLKFILQTETENRILESSSTINTSVPDLRKIHKKKPVMNTSNLHGSASLRGSCTDMSEQLAGTQSPAPINKRLAMLKAGQNGVKDHQRTTSEGSAVSQSARQLSMINSSEDIQNKRKDMSRIMYRQDIFYTGSVTSIAEYRSNPDINQYTQSVVSIPGAPGVMSSNKCAPFTNILFQIFDLSLFKSVTFIVLMSNAFFSFLGFFVPFMFVPDLARIQGASGSKAAVLISILGACNTVGRLAAGWLADRPWADSLLIQNIALITGGIATALVPLYVNYTLLALYCCIFGTSMAVFIALRSIVTAELMGVHKLNNAFGLTIFFQGIAGAAGSPLAGTIFDATGSYAISFVIAGGFITFSGLICLPLRCISKWENSRSSNIMQIDINTNEYQTVLTDELPCPDYGTEDEHKEVKFVENQNV